VTARPPLPRRDVYTPPDWWQPYAAEFPQWRAWQAASQFWARLPGTMRVCHADDAEGLAGQLRMAARTPPDRDFANAHSNDR
jgi:hypothetical protein